MSRNKYGFCESCVDGQDLPPDASCEICRRTNKILGYRKCEYPMTEDDEHREILITRY